MAHIHVQAEQTVNARPEEVYAFLKDYTKRPQILTDNYLNYTVEEGGIGAGTVVTYRLHAARRERGYRIQVSDPGTGQTLQESDTGSSLVTSWTITPIANNQQTRVQITSDWEGGKGVGGFFEKTFAPLGLKRIYTEILGKLAATFAGTQATKV
jgi:hypothetical protein